MDKKNTYLSVLHSHTALMKECSCGRYRQLNSFLYPNNHILKSGLHLYRAVSRLRDQTCICI